MQVLTTIIGHNVYLCEVFYALTQYLKIQITLQCREYFKIYIFCMHTSFDLEPRTIWRATDPKLFTLTPTRSQSRFLLSLKRCRAELLDAEAIFG